MTPPPDLSDTPYVVGGVTLRAITEAACADLVASEASRSHGGWVLTVNTDILRRYEHDARFRRLVADVTLCVADGMPLVWASRLAGTPLPERVAGSDLLFSVSERAAFHGCSIFLLGGNEGTAASTGEMLECRYPGLRIAGTHCPPRGFMDSTSELAVIWEKIVSSKPEIVFVALGCPLQEQLISILRPQWQDSWYLGVGVSFSLASGELSRAPGWMQKCSLEWLHRLIQEPNRLFGRYIRDDFPHALHLLVSAVRLRLLGRREPK